jgi:anti-sigma-K factor RskA
VTWSHTHVEQLLAGQALGVLDPDDAALAERALVEHVPDCPRCRRAMEAYTAVAGDLALASVSVAPPETLSRRVLETPRRSAREARPRSTVRWQGAAAAVVLLVALGASNLVLAGRVSRAEARQALMVEIMAAVGSPQALVVPMRGAPGVRAAMIYVRGRPDAYFMASGLPDPEGEYRLWLVGTDGPVALGSFVPHGGIAMVRSRVDADGVRGVMVTDETSAEVSEPAGPVVVSARIRRD